MHVGYRADLSVDSLLARDQSYDLMTDAGAGFDDTAGVVWHSSGGHGLGGFSLVRL